MIIPKQIKVAGFDYDVDLEFLFKERNDRLGFTDFELSEIKVTNTCDGLPRKRERIEESFIHELLHCIDNGYNADKLEEDTVRRMSKGLYQVLKDNRLLKENYV